MSIDEQRKRGYQALAVVCALVFGLGVCVGAWLW